MWDKSLAHQVGRLLGPLFGRRRPFFQRLNLRTRRVESGPDREPLAVCFEFVNGFGQGGQSPVCLRIGKQICGTDFLDETRECGRIKPFATHHPPPGEQEQHNKEGKTDGLPMGHWLPRRTDFHRGSRWLDDRFARHGEMSRQFRGNNARAGQKLGVSGKNVVNGCVGIPAVAAPRDSVFQRHALEEVFEPGILQQAQRDLADELGFIRIGVETLSCVPKEAACWTSWAAEISRLRMLSCVSRSTLPPVALFLNCTLKTPTSPTPW